MSILKAYANYGVLGHEKKVVYTAGEPVGTATHSEQISIILPEEFKVDENAAGELLVIVPDGHVFLASEVLGAYTDTPVIAWYDAEQRMHREKCRIAYDVAKEIKKMRSQTGLSQTEFADKYHISVANIRDWEQGRRDCPDYVIELLRFKIENE